MTVLSCLKVDWLGQVEILDDDTGSQVEIGADDGNKFVRGLIRGTVGVNKDGKWLCNADSIRELDECTTSELGIDQRFGDPSGKVCC